MSQPVIGYHSIFGAYGFWLPNDPRGSWSKEVKAEHLRAFGAPIHPGTRRSVAGRPHDVMLRIEAKKHLLHKNVIFTDEQIECLGCGFGELVQQTGLAIYALAIMPDHVHIVYPRPECEPEEFVGMFKRAGSRALRKDGLHPFATAQNDSRAAEHQMHPRVAAGAKTSAGAKPVGRSAGAEKQERLPTPWAEKAWHVFLYNHDEIQQRVAYVNNNPIAAGRRAQRWGFVTRLETIPRGRGG